jgi:hypothetical protein
MTSWTESSRSSKPLLEEGAMGFTAYMGVSLRQALDRAEAARKAREEADVTGGDWDKADHEYKYALIAVAVRAEALLASLEKHRKEAAA